MAELSAGIGAGSGCGHNTAAVWAVDACAGGHMQNTFTATEGNVWPSIQTCMPDDSDLAVRVGLGRIVTLHRRSSASYQIC